MSYPNYCNYDIQVYRGSTKRDVLFFAADSYNAGLELAVKSIRSVQSQCRIVILCPTEMILPERIAHIFQRANVEFYSNFTLPKNRSNVPHMIRYEYELSWLKTHKGEVDRVMHSDAFDVFFQKDPFSPQILTDRLLFVVEPHPFRSCGWNLAWIVSCYGEEVLGKMRNNYIICSGSIIGGAKVYEKFVRYLISQPEWSKCWKPSYDQPILNYLVWTGKLQEIVKFDFLGCDSDFLTLQWCLLDNQVKINEFSMVESLQGSSPAFVHQYNRNFTLNRWIFHKCRVIPEMSPVPEPTLPP